MSKELNYFVYRHNFNQHKIEKYNVLSKYIVNEIKDRTKNITDKDEFSEEIRKIMLYHFWSKSEHEIILSSWPTYIKPEELSRITREFHNYQKKFNKQPNVIDVSLTVREKVDIYSQLRLNWDIFINYLWENLR
jgi:folate-binding Fe-S cluster repair protein YgfZ